MKEIPEAVQKVLKQAKSVEVKPIESNADKLFDRHGLAFQKMAIESILTPEQISRTLKILI